jgi:metal-dependent amidase/aminoacylase/carboxypeptidase family protein
MGTFRTMDEDWRFEAHELIRRICFHLTASMGGTADVDIQVGYPPLYNDPEITRRCKELAVAYLGQDKVLDLPIRMTSEDFAFYSQQIPASFYRLGTGSPAGRSPSAVHTPTFDIDEESLRIGSGLMAWLAVGR